MHWLLFYDLSDDYLERRPAYRAEHLALAGDAYERGELVLAGALADPVDGALLVFRGDNASAAESFANADPYVANGLVTSWRVRSWSTVIGDGTSPPGSTPVLTVRRWRPRRGSRPSHLPRSAWFARRACRAPA